MNESIFLCFPFQFRITEPKKYWGKMFLLLKEYLFMISRRKGNFNKKKIKSDVSIFITLLQFEM